MKLRRLNQRKRKGQFYIVAALALILLFFVGLPQETPIQKDPFNDLPFFMENLEREYPKAMTLGLNESDYMNTMMNFTNFANRIMKERSIKYEALWIVTENVSGDNTLNISAGGLIATNATITMNVSGTAAELSLSTNTTNSTTVADPGYQFEFQFSFLDQNETINWTRDKTNLYVFLNLTREENSVLGNVTG